MGNSGYKRKETIKMALFVSKTATKIIPKPSIYLKSTIKSNTINRSGLLVASSQSIVYPHSISSKSNFNGCELNGSKHNFSTSTAKLGDSSIYFTKKHEWVSIVGNMGTVGITDYAQQALGDVVYAQLPDVDAEVVVGEECGALESVKAASELYSPVTGVVIEKNTAVEDLPSLINTSAQSEGWLFKVNLSKSEELEDLLNETSYEEYLKTQEDDH